MSDQEKMLFNQLDSAVEKYRTQAKRYKIITIFFRIITLFLAAASTVLLGLSVPDDPEYLVWSRNLAFVFGAISTIVVGLSTFWNLEPYWIKSKILFARLRALREQYHFRRAKNGNLSADEIEQAFNEYRSLLDAQIEYWEKIEKKINRGAGLHP